MAGSSLTVAIVDDHFLMREALPPFLSQQGFKVVLVTSNGMDLLDQLKLIDKLPDVCIVDIDMPVMNGYETTRQLRNEFPSIKVLAVTLFYDQKKETKILNCGADGFLTKSDEPGRWKTAIISA